MENTFKNNLYKLFKKDARLWNEETKELNETLLKDLIDKLDEKLIELLLNDKQTKEKFFIKIKDVFVLKQNELKFFIDENKLDNSYTQYQNKIGLRVGNKLLSERNEVVLDWPFKDCVLEGGMTKEDQKRNEIFFNEVLAKDEIDRLLDPKAFVQWERYTAKGKEKVKELKRDKDGTIRENLIIKGNNLLALHSLEEQFTGEIKLIYIDPPYNKDIEAFYNDRFNHSSWLVFMKNRLQVASKLLSKDGSIFISIDDKEYAYLKVICDEIFLEQNFLNTITIKTGESQRAMGGGEFKKLRKKSEYLLIYSKDVNYFNFYPLYEESPLYEIVRNKADEGKKYEYTKILATKGERESFSTINVSGDGEIPLYKHKKFVIEDIKYSVNVDDEKIEDEVNKYIKNAKDNFDNVFRLASSQSSILTKVREVAQKGLYSVDYFPRSGKNKGRQITRYFIDGNEVVFLKDSSFIDRDEIIKKDLIGNVWTDIKQQGIANEGGVSLKFGKKPERLLKRIIDLTTDEGDIILDYHAGSGTTCAVAHKMGRQWIGIEQLDYSENNPEERLRNVIAGDKTGISKEVNWKGGGDFIYVQLAKWNEEAKEKILKAKSLNELEKFFDELYERYFLNYNVKTKEFKEKTIKEEGFKNLSLDKQKKFFVEMLDMNQMYVNFSERADKKYNLSKDDIALSEEFYNEKK
jgi:adenine-specific DNA-methyltransferase